MNNPENTESGEVYFVQFLKFAGAFVLLIAISLGALVVLGKWKNGSSVPPASQTAGSEK